MQLQNILLDGYGYIVGIYYRDFTSQYKDRDIS